MTELHVVQDDGRKLIIFRGDDVVLRPDPRVLRFGRTRRAVTRAFVLLWSAVLTVGGIFALTQGEWRGVGGLIFGSLLGVGAFVFSSDPGTGEHVRVRCPVCNYLTFLLDPNAIDAYEATRAGEATAAGFSPNAPCPLCEWQTDPLYAWDPRPDPGEYELERARQNFRAHGRYYAPDEVEGWSNWTPTENERAAKRAVMDLSDRLAQLPVGREKFSVWKTLGRASDRLRRDTARRLGARATLLYRIDRVKRWLASV